MAGMTGDTPVTPHVVWHLFL